MPEANQIRYTLQEITALMLKDQGIKSGHWAIQTVFSWAIENIISKNGPPGPGVISVLTEVGIQKTGGAGPMSVDAAQLGVNERTPRSPAGKQRRSTQRKAKAS